MHKIFFSLHAELVAYVRDNLEEKLYKCSKKIEGKHDVQRTDYTLKK